MRFSRWLTVAVLLAAACGGSNQDVDSLAGPAATVEARQGETFRLRPGETARIAGAGLLVGFRAVTQDSRCPADVVCVWEGDASARIRASADGRSYTPFDLHTTLDPKTAEFAGRTITLVSVEPYPTSDARIDPARYVITLRID